MIRASTKNVQDLEKLLLALPDSIKCISFDVFDTLLLRAVYPPTPILHRTTQELHSILSEHQTSKSLEELQALNDVTEEEIRRENRDQGLDPECPLSELFTRWVAKAHKGNGKSEFDYEKVANHLLAFELETEAKFLKLNWSMYGLMERLRQSGKKVILISDTFFSSTELKELLSKAGVEDFDFEIFTSSEHRLSKASGRLFQKTLKEHDLAPSQTLHIGDDPWGDYASPSREGIHAVLHREKNHLRRQDEIRAAQELSKQDPYWKGVHLNLLCRSTAKESLGHGDFYYEQGFSQFGPIFSVFVHRLIEKVQQYKLDSVLFSARDGFLLKSIYDLFEPHFFAGKEKPFSSYICTSRKSTALASLRHLTSREIQIGIDKCNPQGLLSVFRAYSLPPDKLAPIAKEYGIHDLATPIEAFWEDDRLLSFIADERVQALARKLGEEAREKLAGYLDRFHFWGQDRKVGFVDIGWRGTVQDNIIHALNHRPDFPMIFGLYFGKRKRNNALEFSQSFSEGLVYDYRRHDVAEQGVTNNLYLYEQGPRASHSTTIGYEIDDITKQMNAVLRNIKGLDEKESEMDHLLSRIQLGAMDYAKRYLAMQETMGYSASDSLPFIRTLTSRMVQLPRKNEAENWMNFPLSEDAGEENILTFGLKGFRWYQIGKWPKLFQTYRQIMWWQSMLRLCRLPGATWGFSVFRTAFRGQR